MGTAHHRRSNGRADPFPPALRARSWRDLPDLRHGFLGRDGGVSGGAFRSLNLSTNVGDDARNVRENRARAGRWLEPLRLVVPKQVHGNHAVVVDADVTGPGEADALVTRCSGVAVGVLTADCVPILLVSEQPRAAAVIHAGWRGAAMGIVERTLEVMRRHLNVEPARLRAALGPAIGACCYEVGAEVVEALERGHGALPEGALRARGGRPSVDLRAVSAAALVRAGVAPARIETVGPCTSCAAASFFSHRAGGGAPTGRQLSVVGWGVVG